MGLSVHQDAVVAIELDRARDRLALVELPAQDLAPIAVAVADLHGHDMPQALGERRIGPEGEARLGEFALLGNIERIEIGRAHV